ncbi:MAG: cyclic nucleotide-binding domain-containing protein [Gammaproteobacteria bacterium]|nr:cyclic nucleotide-binding domain-containing protein [Gammaproteobacteria bacterium]MCP4090485.1 cyclic nucleotide-binding domain-containing protein [Gammaproteobacteria bacterium]MCP4276650.1 cyclic nucleotide-binding domain-containing protein [Gammaproteobacteria bacterium]MCP4831400.1 cyclic nucleotide-binding domain-containing protein [Gammaproteobacteria bacterium]MCP4927944.1 cyclic nucleotide-binding domain-containing protein [Gammaproteobacteria bacterium]
MPTELSNEVLKGFSPIGGLKRQNLEALVKKTTIRELEAGQLLFKVGNNEKHTIFLVTGSVELCTNSGERTIIEAGTPEARNAICPYLPRQYTARAIDDIEYISIDSDLLDVMLTWDQTGNYEVSEIENNSDNNQDWMTTLLQTKAFHRIPPANIQAIFIRMQQVNFKAGDIIIKQGDEGDFFYTITRGQCSIVRETPLNKEGVKLAELGIGQTFGEESLISECKRNATVIMTTDGSVMRLAKDDFNELLNEPMLDWVKYAEAKELAAGGAIWLDVRLPSEYESFHEEGAINIPLYFIRLKLSTLDKNKTYLLCCDTGRRSSAGAFILNEQGFDTRILHGGLNTSELE